VLCKVRASKLWDVVFGEQLWRALGYMVVVTLGLIVGGAVVGALVLRYCEAGGIGDLALHVSCKPLLLVTLLSAIGKQCVPSLLAVARHGTSGRLGHRFWTTQIVQVRARDRSTAQSAASSRAVVEQRPPSPARTSSSSPEPG
jgi:hypothetical protein